MKYPVILADPPWHFENYSADEPGMIHNRARGANKHYPTMTTEQICGLPVANMAADDSVLLLWACWPTLPEALQVITAWGFTYKALAWVWVKLNPSSVGFHMGMGYWTRANSEPCLLATRGDPRKPVDRGIQALICTPVHEHSRKPDDQYRKIEALFPTGPYLELFARRKRPSWDAWGNEVESDITLAATI
jgi:N6-adenosine-specific RNA methylase IME4